MKLKYVKEILKHYNGPEYDDWDIEFWDYNNQRTINVGEGMYSSSKTDKRIVFPVSVEPVDGITIDERLKKFIEKYNKNKPQTILGSK